MPRRCVRRLCEQKSDSNLPDCVPIPFEWQIDSHAECFQHIRRPALRTRRAVSVLGHARSCGCRYNRRRGRNVERPRSVAAGPTRIHHVCWSSFAVNEHARSVPAHHLCETCKFLRLHGPPVQRFEQPHNLGRPKASRKQLFHQRFGVTARQGSARLDAFDQS